MINILLVFLFLLASVGFAENTPLPPVKLIQKLSLKMRGISPSLEESNAFASAIAKNPSAFYEIYQKKIQFYLASDEFYRRVEDFHSYWWHIRAAESTQLARYIVKNNRPYFEFLNKNYVVLNGSSSTFYARSNIKTEAPLPARDDDWQAVRLEATEKRFRSILSNQDILDRYPDTASNLNRTRSNYVLKTFLCETLSPSVPVDLPQGPSAPVPGEHGTNRDCMGCHYRLDPLARFFDHWRPNIETLNSTWYDESRVARGAFITRSSDGKVNIAEGAGESELAKILTSEPRVKSCAVTKAWDFFIGSDVPLADRDQRDLVEILKKNMLFKDLIVAIANHPYFWSQAEVPALNFNDVKSTFQVCTSCHQSDGDISPKFDPQTYPFLQTPDKNFELLKRVSSAINWQDNIKAMPPSPRPQLPQDNLQKIKLWISAGARDNQGKQTLNDSQIEEFLHD